MPLQSFNLSFTIFLLSLRTMHPFFLGGGGGRINVWFYCVHAKPPRVSIVYQCNLNVWGLFLESPNNKILDPESCRLYLRLNN